MVCTGSGRGLPLPPSSPDAAAAACARGLGRTRSPWVRRGTPGTRRRPAGSLRGCSTA